MCAVVMDDKSHENDSTSVGVLPGVESQHCHCAWPEESGIYQNMNWFHRQYLSWTYSYMSPILQQGARQNAERRLTQSDLFPVPTTMKSRHLVVLFQKHYRLAFCCVEGGSCSAPTTQLIKTLWRLASPTFVPAGICQLVTVLCQVSLPLLTHEILRVIEDNPNKQVVLEGMPYALSIFVVALVNAFSNHRHRHLALQSGIIVRAATISILYSRLLLLTHKGKVGLASGEVTNLIATGTSLFNPTAGARLTNVLDPFTPQ